MSSPYATVILPTLNRHSTLPYAIASVLAQTESSLELLIVLDGATELCRTEAIRAASRDKRVRVLDLPKAPASGEQNTDFAVQQSAADRIFYLDDDDLMLPHHVAILGNELDHADVTESRLCSADRKGKLHLGVAQSCNVEIRRLLSQFQLKMLYDTQFAHRKSAYGKFSTWVPSKGEGKRPVWEFFRGFAANSDCRWSSTKSVTAINLHGACRRDMSLESRADELNYWQNLARNESSFKKELNRADTHFNLYRLLSNDPHECDSLSEYLDLRGGYESANSGIEIAIFDLLTGGKPSDDYAIEIAALSSEIIESGYWSILVANQFCKTFGVNKAAVLFESAEGISSNRAGNLFARSSIEKRRDLKQALDYARQSCEEGPDPLHILKRWQTELEFPNTK